MRVPGIPYVQGRNSYTDRDGRKYGIAIHNTSNDASDSGEASYATRRTDGVSSHFYVDADSVTQSLDTAARAGHAGSYEGNEHAIAVEITGTNGKSRAWWLANVAWDKLGAVLAAVIRHHWPDGSFQVRRASVAEMKANPKVKALYGHDDMRQAWGGTTHTDPGPNFPWDRLIEAVNAALGEDDEMEQPEKWQLRRADVYGYALVTGAERTLEVPDHTGKMVSYPVVPNVRIRQLTEKVDDLAEQLDALAARPALTLTPEQLDELTRQLAPVVAAAVAAREADADRARAAALDAQG